MTFVKVEIEKESIEAIEELRTSPAVGGTPEDPASRQAVIQHIVNSLAAGIRRRGSWERGIVQQLFGTWGNGKE